MNKYIKQFLVVLLIAAVLLSILGKTLYVRYQVTGR